MIGKNHSVKKFSIFKLQFQFHNHLIKLLKTEIERTGGLRRINDVKWYFREISPAGLSNVFFTAVNIKKLIYNLYHSSSSPKTVAIGNNITLNIQSNEARLNFFNVLATNAKLSLKKMISILHEKKQVYDK